MAKVENVSFNLDFVEGTNFQDVRASIKYDIVWDGRDLQIRQPYVARSNLLGVAGSGESEPDTEMALPWIQRRWLQPGDGDDDGTKITIDKSRTYRRSDLQEDPVGNTDEFRARVRLEPVFGRLDTVDSIRRELPG
jgi:hypothetical protein